MFRELGYGPRQAAFLALVAVHGGHFLRRQFTRFIGSADGAVTRGFVQKLSANDHGTETTWNRRTRVYHLDASALYAAIGDPDSRLRRSVSAETVIQRLMKLDVVLDHRHQVFLGSEADKFEYFTKHRAVPVDDLPGVAQQSPYQDGSRRPRCFQDRAPILLPPNDGPLGFVYVSWAGGGIGEFQAFLARYGRLWRRLHQVRLIYATPMPEAASWARDTLTRALQDVPESGAEASRCNRVRAHFQARQRVQTGQFTGCTQAELDRLREDLHRFSGPRYDRLYERWLTEGEPVVTAAAHRSGGGPPFLWGCDVVFTVHALRYAYPTDRRHPEATNVAA